MDELKAPDKSFEISKWAVWRFQLVHATPPPSGVDRTNQPRMTRRLRSTPITGVSSLLRAGPPARPASVLSRRLRESLDRRRFSLSPPRRTDCIRTHFLLFHTEAADQARVVCMPDTAWPVGGHPPDSSQDRFYAPVLMSSFCFRHVSNDSLALAFLIPT